MSRRPQTIRPRTTCIFSTAAPATCCCATCRSTAGNGGTASKIEQTVALFSGNAGGRIYNLAFDFHEERHAARRASHVPHRRHHQSARDLSAEHRRGACNDPQVMIKNAKNVTWYGFKYENTSGDHELLHIIGSDNIGILGGSGNYTSGKPFVAVNGSTNVTVTALARQGTVIRRQPRRGWRHSASARPRRSRPTRRATRSSSASSIRRRSPIRGREPRA